MTPNTLKSYQNVETPLPNKQIGWPLYGAGLENLGLKGLPV